MNEETSWAVPCFGGKNQRCSEFRAKRKVASGKERVGEAGEVPMGSSKKKIVIFFSEISESFLQFTDNTLLHLSLRKAGTFSGG